MKIVVSEKPEPETIEIFNVKNIRGSRKSKESKNLTTVSLDSSKILQNLEENTDGVRNADTDVKAECEDFDEKYTTMSADDDGDNDNDDNNDNGDNNDDDNTDDGEESSVKHKDFTANVDDDDLDGDGDSVLSELDHEDDFENEESDIDTKPSVTDRKMAKAKPSKKSEVS